LAMLTRSLNEPQVETQATKSAAMGTLWTRASCRIVAAAKKLFPVVAIFAVFAAVLTATIALRVAIWVPLHFHQ
jgi:hypothetical protein